MRRRIRRTTNIDITPLMDVTFMLLIIFIITVPAMEYSTDVTPPQMETPQTVEDVQNKVVAELGKDGIVKIDGRAVDKGDLLAAFRELAMNRPDANLLIICDGQRSFEEVIEIHRNAHHAKVKNIYLVTQAEKK